MSQFIVEKIERKSFFAAIAERLRAGGYLVSADLSGNNATI
ncbi:MAG: hypothetical protein ACI935_001222 [Moritella dasanensis]